MAVPTIMQMSHMRFTVHSWLAVVLLCCCGDGTHMADAGSDMYGSGSYCNPVFQNGCNAEERCIVLGDHPGCVPQGTIPSGQPCNVDDDQCIKGSMCISGICMAFCDGTVRCESGLCSDNATMTCSVSCDPLGPTCSAGLECFLPLGVDYGETPGCLAPGNGAEGTACTSPNDCGIGLTCAVETMPILGYASCVRSCLTGSPACNGASSCHERHVGDGYGVCY